MNNGIFGLARKRRIGKKVFHVKDEIYRQCLQAGVTDQDIMREFAKYRRVGIETTWSVAAQSAAREKMSKKGFRGFQI